MDLGPLNKKIQSFMKQIIEDPTSLIGENVTFETGTLGCFKAGQLNLQLVPQLNPNSISQFPNLARVGVQVGVAALNGIYSRTI